MTLESGVHLVNNEACPKLPQHFHEHNGADVLNAFKGIFWDREQPFPFPGSWNVLVLPDGSETLVSLRVPVLNMLELQAGWATKGVPLLGLDEGS